jgi:uncharacterized protein YbjT (DUF2867 family)
MRAYVLGATGFVGREVVRQLCVRGAQVVAHVRPDSKQLDSWRARFGELGAAVDTSPWQADALASSLREVRATHIYITIGTTRAKAKADAIEGDIYEQVDLGLTKIAVEAARTSGVQPRLICLSAIGADASARGKYMRARGKAEAVVRDSGLPWVIARPSFITGEREESRPGERTAAVMTDGLLAVARVLGGKQLRARYRSTTADVLASALIRLGEDPDGANKIAQGDDLR